MSAARSGEPPENPRPTGLAAVLAELNTPRDDGVHPLWAAIGGVRGVVDSSLPTMAFVIADLFAGLRTSILAALVLSGLLLAFRSLRGEPLQPAVGGLFAVGVASLVAVRMHSARGYFLPGILLQIPYAVAAVVSVLLGRPVVGYLAAVADPRLAQWRSVPQLRRAASYATLLWAAVFTVRIAVMVPLYLAHRTSALGVAKLAMGWPLWAMAAGGSLLLIRRASSHALEGVGTTAPATQGVPSNRPS